MNNTKHETNRNASRTLGQIAYEADVIVYPHYHDGTPRNMWDELPEYARWTWVRNPRPSVAGNTV